MCDATRVATSHFETGLGRARVTHGTKAAECSGVKHSSARCGACFSRQPARPEAEAKVRVPGYAARAPGRLDTPWPQETSSASRGAERLPSARPGGHRARPLSCGVPELCPSVPVTGFCAGCARAADLAP